MSGSGSGCFSHAVTLSPVSLIGFTMSGMMDTSWLECVVLSFLALNRWQAISVAGAGAELTLPLGAGAVSTLKAGLPGCSLLPAAVVGDRGMFTVSEAGGVTMHSAGL